MRVRYIRMRKFESYVRISTQNKFFPRRVPVPTGRGASVGLPELFPTLTTEPVPTDFGASVGRPQLSNTLRTILVPTDWGANVGRP